MAQVVQVVLISDREQAPYLDEGKLLGYVLQSADRLLAADGIRLDYATHTGKRDGSRHSRRVTGN